MYENELILFINSKTYGGKDRLSNNHNIKFLDSYNWNIPNCNNIF